MLLSKKPLAAAVMLFAAGGLGVSSTAWSASGSSELPNMVVSATGYQQEALRAPASITVVDHEQIQRKPVADLAEVLRDIPGVDIVDSGVAGMKRISCAVKVHVGYWSRSMASRFPTIPAMARRCCWMST